MTKKRLTTQTDSETLDLFPQAATHVQDIPLGKIDPGYHRWEVRRSAPAQQVEAQLQTGFKWGVGETLRVVPHGGGFALVTGRVQYEAARRAGHETVRAEVLPSMTSVALLSTALAAELTKRRCSVLERGWGLARLEEDLRAGSATRITRRQLAAHLNIPYTDSLKGQLSESLKVAKRLPEDVAEKLAERHGCTISDISKHTRKVWRLMKKAPTPLLPRLWDCIAVASREGVPVAEVLEAELQRATGSRPSATASPSRPAATSPRTASAKPSEPRPAAATAPERVSAQPSAPKSAPVSASTTPSGHPSAQAVLAPTASRTAPSKLAPPGPAVMDPTANEAAAPPATHESGFSRWRTWKARARAVAKAVRHWVTARFRQAGESARALRRAWARGA
jgi:hypothetical protein